jgi:16S rRNA (cytosine967-C5)-methyltransferase
MGPQSDRSEELRPGSLVVKRPAEPALKRGKHQSPGRAEQPSQPGLAARQAAARLLAAIIDARTPLDGLTDSEHGHPQFRALESRDRALVRAILVSALRHRRSIEALIAARLRSPLPANATTLSHILHVGAAQILFLVVPDSAAVDLAVSHAKADPRTARFAALVNAVLRGIAREKLSTDVPAFGASSTIDAPTPNPSPQGEGGLGRGSSPSPLRGGARGRLSCETVADAPDWFIDRLTKAYGAARTAAILGAHRIESPTDFTVKSDPQRWADAFGGIVLPTGSMRVARLPASVPDLPGFAEGEWWVQDAAAALPARLFGDIRGKRVADLCPAPGGKTAQLAVAGAHITAVDASRNRLNRLQANLDRLGLAAEIVEADILKWQPAEPFDAILLDAPCSSTGTVRRHPDVPWTKSLADVEKLAGLQRRMLDHAFALLKPGGAIVFSNCSLDPLEGEEMVRAFLQNQPNAASDPIKPGEVPGIDGYITAEGWLRTTPADMDIGDPALSGMDGFFAARLRRNG